MKQTAQAHVTPEKLSKLLAADHARLDRIFAALIEAFRADARADCRHLWTLFERGLLAHLSFEEKHLFPAFRSEDPTEAAALLAEHEQLRAMLTELGIGVDLHMVNSGIVEALVAQLQAHAKREEALLYRWANDNVIVEPPFAIAYSEPTGARV